MEVFASCARCALRDPRSPVTLHREKATLPKHYRTSSLLVGGTTYERSTGQPGDPITHTLLLGKHAGWPAGRFHFPYLGLIAPVGVGRGCNWPSSWGGETGFCNRIPIFLVYSYLREPDVREIHDALPVNWCRKSK
jgi:hypothetical protein